MDKKPLDRAKLNIITSMAFQFVTIICGIIVPKLFVSAYGSEVYGTTTSITQFLSYISLIEGGIGGVARAALYRPLAQQDNAGISNIYNAASRFFRWIGLAF